MRLGIIGCGLIGQKRVQAALALGYEVAMVADIDPRRTATLAGRAKAKATQDWREVAEADLDAVVIAATHEFLSEMSIACCAAGKHVLVEKPAGRNAKEVGAVATAAREHNRVVKVGFNHRFHPAILKAREIFESGALGPMMYIRGRYGHGGRIGYEKEWRCVREKSGGGELIDQGAHLIDLSRWFLGELTLDYAATPTYFWDIPVDDNCFLALKAPGGQIAWLHATWSEWKNMFSLEIVGRDGKLTIDGLGGSYGLERLTYHKMLPQMGPPETTIWEYPFPDTSWDRELQNFSTAIETGCRATGDIEDALAMHKLIDQAYGLASV
jgi:predicted dehydrogenase